MAVADGPHTRTHAIRRLAESEGPVLFARFDEAEKCEFIEANVPVDAWSSTNDGAGFTYQGKCTARAGPRDVGQHHAPSNL